MSSAKFLLLILGASVIGAFTTLLIMSLIYCAIEYLAYYIKYKETIYIKKFIITIVFIIILAILCVLVVRVW